VSPAPAAPLPQAFFLPAAPAARAGGQRFCLFHAPASGAARGSVLVLHPFAEELNNTRRLVALQARALAQAGFAVLQIDLFGCGDSSGDFEDAQWDDWLTDAALGRQWLAGQTGGPLWVWGLRAGALLASTLAAQPLEDAEIPPGLLLWQPVPEGQQALQQFLRLHAASQWLGRDAAATDAPARRLQRDESVEIAGYTLTPALARGLQQARLTPCPATGTRRLIWLDTSTQAAPTLSPASERHIGAWRAAGWSVHAEAVAGPAFWQQIGTDDAPRLIAATMAALSHGDPA
jgi:uncharacterized protein